MLKGMQKLAARLDALAANADRAAQAGILASARAACGDVRRLAPVDTGELRGSIFVVRINAHCAAVIASAPHAAMVEYGSGKSAAKPFMLPAAQLQRGRLALEARRAYARRKGGGT